MGGGVGLDSIARGHHDEPERGDGNAEQIPVGPAKDIQDLGQGEIGDSADHTAQDADGGRERVLCEGGSDIGGQGGRGAGQHSLDQVGEPDQHVGGDEGGGRPCHGHGLDVLDSELGTDI